MGSQDNAASLGHETAVARRHKEGWAAAADRRPPTKVVVLHRQRLILRVLQQLRREAPKERAVLPVGGQDQWRGVVVRVERRQDAAVAAHNDC